MKSFCKTVVLSFVLIAALASCDPAKQFEAELKSIDSCLAELDKIDSLFKGIEFDSLTLMVGHVNRNEDLMKEYYVADTIDEILGSYMNSCKGIRKSIKNINLNKQEFEEEILAINLQLNNLKADILNGIYDKKQISEYLTAEKDALNKLNLSFMEFYNNQREQKGVYYLCVPVVDEYVKSLNIQDADSLQ